MRPGLADFDDIGRVNLIDGRQRSARQHGRHRAAAVLGHRIAVVLGPMADVEPGHDPLRNAAATPEEAVRDVRQGFGADDLDRFSQGCG